MRSLILLFLAFFLCFIGNTLLRAQKVNIIIPGLTSYSPVIDGIEDMAWADMDPVILGLGFYLETPTVTAYWKALYDLENIYVLVHVEDDDHHPSWETEGYSWEYDRPEIYFDVNDTLNDGMGPSAPGSGHYQFAPGFEQDGYGKLHEASGSAQTPGGQYAYIQTGESYLFECAIRISSMSNKHGYTMDCYTLATLKENIGFDITIVDQDEGVTTSRQRAIWQSGDDGLENEAWNNMDACGTIQFEFPCFDDCWDPDCIDAIKEVKNGKVFPHPNPVSDMLSVGADFDRVIISDIAGREFRGLKKTGSGQLDVSILPKGLYVIKVYKDERYIAAAGIIKN